MNDEQIITEAKRIKIGICACSSSPDYTCTQHDAIAAYGFRVRDEDRSRIESAIKSIPLYIDRRNERSAIAIRNEALAAIRNGEQPNDQGR